MNKIRGNIARKRILQRPKPYVMKENKRTGKLYLKRERPPFIGELPYVMALVIAVCFAMFSCLYYIQVRTKVEYRIHQMEALERQFLSLKNNNTLTERELYRTPDLNHIYEIAIEELGMVPATENNVRLFERSNSEFVYQTDNIPNMGF